jgi:phosphate transport system substrate-binding protein
MNGPRRKLGLTGLIIVGLAVSGCGDENTASNQGHGNGGALNPAAAIIVDGSSTVFRISKAAQEAFAAINPDVTVVVDNHGTGGGFSRYLQGEVDIVDASRNAEDKEEATAKAQGIEWTRFFVGNDGITLVVHSKNTFAKSLTVEQLKRMWQPGSTVKTWKDVDPSWPDRKIVFYSPDNDSGTFEFFTEAIVGKKKAQRDGVQQSADDNTLVSGVSNDEDGIGYFGYAYYAANKDKLTAIAVQNGPDAKPVLPSPETIANKSYKPLSRPLFIFVKNGAAKRPEVKQFVLYYLDHVDELAVKGGYDPPTSDDHAANKETLEKLFPGERGGSAAPAPSTSKAAAAGK